MNNEHLSLDKKSFDIYSTSSMDIDGLVKAIRHHNLGVRWHATRILAEIGEPAIPQLVSLLREGDSDVQWHSALTLSMIGKPLLTH